jgi:tetratricopeptide (TPR) repeat protein
MRGLVAATSRYRLWFFAAALLLCAAAIKPAQDRVDAGLARSPSIDPDLLYLASPGAVKSLSLGYQSLVADLYWIRAVQYYGRREEAARRQVRYKNLAALLDITTTLDPEMMDVYRAGSSFLAEPEPIGAGQPEEALKLLDKGIAFYPDEWRLCFDKGFVYFWAFKDFNQAGQVWLEASRMKSAPPWMEGLAAMALSRGGAVETARALWERQYQNSASREVKENAKNHLFSMQVDEMLWTIEFLAGKYAEKHGRYPARLDELVRAGYLKAVPVDPSGVPFDYDPHSGKAGLSAGTKVRYLKVPYDYREAFRQKLASLFPR